MAQKVHKVVIGGLEYKLTSDDETSLRTAVELVNVELDELHKQSDVKLPITQLYVLVALNLAERLSKLEKSIVSEREYFTSEINTLTELIDKSIS
jgi:cell division protein ZapA (FtsZ GTPase activity inhibitor)